MSPTHIHLKRLVTPDSASLVFNSVRRQPHTLLLLEPVRALTWYSASQDTLLLLVERVHALLGLLSQESPLLVVLNLIEHVLALLGLELFLCIRIAGSSVWDWYKSGIFRSLDYRSLEPLLLTWTSGLGVSKKRGRTREHVRHRCLSLMPEVWNPRDGCQIVCLGTLKSAQKQSKPKYLLKTHIKWIELT